MNADPGFLLRNVYWAFDGDPFADIETFERAVIERMTALDEGDEWDPTERVLPRRRVRVKYHGVIDPESCEYDEDLVVELRTGEAEGFTAGELLFRLHNAVVAQLRDADHRYFEGLELLEPGGDHEPPLYELVQGS